VVSGKLKSVHCSIAPQTLHAGRMLIDGEIYTPSEATKKFLAPSD
jgi:hypothetical protein